MVYLKPRNDRIAITTTIAPIIQMMLFIGIASAGLALTATLGSCSSKRAES